MEYRKLISFGKNSYVVSLPKVWVKQNKLKKGDLIYLEESGGNILLSKKEFEKKDDEKEKMILVDGKSFSLVSREVNTAYIMNYRKIILKGKELKNRVKELQSVIQNLIALEIMEQTTDSIVAKDFLNMDKVSIEELIRKMDVVTRTMLKESCRIFVEDNYEGINERDKDVNRLYFLLYRAIIYNLDNPAKALKIFTLSPLRLLRLHSVGFYIEGIADEARRAARFARLLKISTADKKSIEVMMNKIYQNYEDTMKAYYVNDTNFALQTSEFKSVINTEIDVIEAKNIAVENLSNTLSRLRRIVGYTHNIGRVVYTVNDSV